MLSRHFLRTKVLQSLYAYSVSGGDDLGIIEKNFLHNIERLNDLGVTQVSALLYFFEVAKKNIEDAKAKFCPTEDEMNPCYNEERLATVCITPFEDTPVDKEFLVVPQKHWEIPLLYSSHEDLGYCAYIEKLHYECYEYLKKAMELCQKHDGFKYMIEHYWWLDAFDSYATEEEKALLKDLFVKKKIDLSAVCSGVHTSWASSEQLVRGMYFGCLEAKEKYGVSPKCAFYVDLSGVSWSAVNCFTKMGIKYIGILANGFRNSSPNTNIPPLGRTEADFNRCACCGDGRW